MINTTLLALLLAQGSLQHTTYGVEIAFRSGHADRGFIINDRPVVQPVMWFSGSGTEFSAWSNFALAQTTDGARPRIVELELTHEQTWGKVTAQPALRMFFYHDALSTDRTRSLEGWLTLSYDVGPFQLFTRQSLDVLTYKGAYFVDAGIARRALDRVGAEMWLTVYKKRFYVGPHFEFSTIVDPAVRAATTRPTYLLVRLSLGGEF